MQDLNLLPSPRSRSIITWIIVNIAQTTATILCLLTSSFESIFSKWSKLYNYKGSLRTTHTHFLLAYTWLSRVDYHQSSQAVASSFVFQPHFVSANLRPSESAFCSKSCCWKIMIRIQFSGAQCQSLQRKFARKTEVIFTLGDVLLEP